MGWFDGGIPFALKFADSSSMVKPGFVNICFASIIQDDSGFQPE